MTQPLLEILDLTGGYDGAPVLNGISFKVMPGDFLGIIGPNGSGKSTLLRLLSGALTPFSGRVNFSGRSLSSINRKEFCRKTAFIPQDTLIQFPFTVWEIVLMGRIPHLGRLQLEREEDFAACRKALGLTDTLHLKDKDISELSAGERQRVIISRALSQEPVLLFLDEPTSHLDIGHQIQVLDMLRRLNRETRLTIVMVVHDLNLACEYCSRLILLNGGGIFKEGAAEEVLTYQNIESVYKTVVVVGKNPISKKPHVMLISEENRCRHE